MTHPDLSFRRFILAAVVNRLRRGWVQERKLGETFCNHLGEMRVT